MIIALAMSLTLEKNFFHLFGTGAGVPEYPSIKSGLGNIVGLVSRIIAGVKTPKYVST